jgi:hypothetical protein
MRRLNRELGPDRAHEVMADYHEACHHRGLKYDRFGTMHLRIMLKRKRGELVPLRWFSSITSNTMAQTDDGKGLT